MQVALIVLPHYGKWLVKGVYWEDPKTGEVIGKGWSAKYGLFDPPPHGYASLDDLVKHRDGAAHTIEVLSPKQALHYLGTEYTPKELDDKTP